MKTTTAWTPAIALVLAALAGCSEPGAEQDNTKIRQALDEAAVTLNDSVSIAESSLEGGVALKATILTKSKVLSVGALAGNAFNDVRISPSGEVVSTQAVQDSETACEGSVSLSETITAAENAVAGEAVTVIPDDDDPCDREVKVLDGDDVLWEVKIAPDGSVKETEVADDAEEADG